MEKTIKKLFVAGSLLVGAAVSFMSLTTYAVSAEGSAAINGVTSNTTFSLTVDNVLTLKNVSGGSTINASPSAVVETGSISATVTSNSKYTLSLSASKPQLTLSNADATADDTKQIPAGVPAAGKNAWGVKKSGASTYTALTSTQQTFFTSAASAPTEAGTTTTFGIGVSVAPSLPAGEYSTIVTVTAAAQ